MTDQEKETMHLNHRHDMLMATEKSAHKSKKFMAWLIQQIFMTTIAIILLVTLVKQPTLGWQLSASLVGIIFMMGVSTMWYLGKQAAADIAVRGYAMVGKIAGLTDKVKDEGPP